MMEQDYDQTVRAFDERIAALEATVEQQDHDHGRALLFLTVAWAASMLVMLGLALMLEHSIGVLQSEIFGALS